MSQQTDTTPKFPSVEHREALFQRLKNSGSYQIFTEAELVLWHAYHYAWFYVRRNEKYSPVDPDRRWFQPDAVAAAVEFYRKKFGIAAPTPHRQPTPEEIAHTERRTKMAIANLEERGRAAFHDPVQQVREAMGVTATERKLHPYEDDDAVRRAAKELGL